MVEPALIPILFPHTFVSPARMTELLSVFPVIALRRPGEGPLPEHLQSACDAGRVDVTAPGDAEGVDLHRLAAEYRQWLEDTRGADARVRHLSRKRPPLVAETSVARLRGMIAAGKDGPAEPPPDDSRRLAQLFLLAAEERALADEQLSAALNSHDEKTRTLFERLHGDPDELAGFPMPGGSAGIDDPCAHMTQQWITAWCRLVSDEPVIPGVWLTFSEAVVQWLGEVFEEMTPAGAVTHRELADLENGDPAAALCRRGGKEDGAPSSAGDPPAAVVFCLRGVSPRTAVERLLGRGASAPEGGAADAGAPLAVIRWL